LRDSFSFVKVDTSTSQRDIKMNNLSDIVIKYNDSQKTYIAYFKGIEICRRKTPQSLKENICKKLEITGTRALMVQGMILPNIPKSVKQPTFPKMDLTFKIIAKVEEVRLQSLKLWPNAMTSQINVDFFNTTKVAGWAFPSRNMVKFNTVLAEENWDHFDETIRHEIAHLIAFKVYPRLKQAHGPEFRSVCQALGGSGRTFHSYDISSVRSGRTYNRFEGKCACMTHGVTKATADKIKKYNQTTCRRCKSKVVLTGNMITIKK
jgi:SprT protein